MYYVIYKTNGVEYRRAFVKCGRELNKLANKVDGKVFKRHHDGRLEELKPKGS